MPDAHADTASRRLDCDTVREIQNAFLGGHVRFRRPAPELHSRTAESLLALLDPGHLLYAEEELALPRSRIQDAVARHDCTALVELDRDAARKRSELAEFAVDRVSSPSYAAPRTRPSLSQRRSRPSTADERRLVWSEQVDAEMALWSSLAPEQARDRLIDSYRRRAARALSRTEEDVYATFLNAFALSLDPHSNYLSRRDLEDFMIGMDTSLAGVGLALASREGIAVVEEVIPGSAAARQAEVRPADLIVSVGAPGAEPELVVGWELRDVVRLLRGARDTQVELGIVRGEASEAARITLTRADVDLEAQAAQLRFETAERGGRVLKLAILTLPSFYGDRNPEARQASRDVERLLGQVAAAGADGLLLDLQRNSGGLLEDAIRLTGLFMSSGAVIALKAPNAKEKVLSDDDPRIAFNGPLVLLTSSISAAATEILAAALQDRRRALVVGDETTFGKGTVQSVLPLSPGLGALKITTACFYRLDGTRVQNVGVASDVVLPSVTAFSLKSDACDALDVAVPTHARLDLRVDDGASRVAPQGIAALKTRSRLRVRSNPSFGAPTYELRVREGVEILADYVESEQAARGGRVSRMARASP